MHSPSDAMLEYIISLAQHFDALDSEQIAMIMYLLLDIHLHLLKFSYFLLNYVNI